MKRPVEEQTIERRLKIVTTTKGSARVHPASPCLVVVSGRATCLQFSAANVPYMGVQCDTIKTVAAELL